MPGIFATPLMLGATAKVLEGLAASVPFPKRLGKPEEFGEPGAGADPQHLFQRPVPAPRRRHSHGAALTF